MLGVVKKLSKTKKSIAIESSNTLSEDTDENGISLSLEINMLLFILHSIETIKKIQSETKPLDQITAAIQISQSPTNPLDLLSKAVNNKSVDRYNKIAAVIQAELTTNEIAIIKSNKHMLMSKYILSESEWEQVSMALNVLVEKHNTEPLFYFLLAKAEFNKNKANYKKAIEWARNGLRACGEDAPEWLHEYLQRALAVCLSAAAAHGSMDKDDKDKFKKEAIGLLKYLNNKNEEDPIISYNLALVLAESNEYIEALNYTKASMTVCEGNFDLAWALHTLLLSANHDMEMSMKMINAGLSDCSDIYEPMLLSIKQKLLIEIGKQDESILLIANACSRYKNLEKEHECKRWKEMRRKQQEQLWQELTLNYLSAGRMKDAEFCLSEMGHINPCSSTFLSIRGCVKEKENYISQAIQYYEMALAIDPDCHIATLHLGILYCKKAIEMKKKSMDTMTYLVLAYTLLMKNVRFLNSDDHLSWYYLGLVCKEQGRIEEAKNHFQKSASMASMASVIPFKYLPRIF